MTISEASKKLKESLLPVYEKRETGRISGMIMENLTGLSQTQRLILKEKDLTQQQEKKLQDFIAQLLQHKPVQYVLHEAWFFGMKFYVDEHVLIPRPETEELVELIIKQPSLKHPAILDIGCGTGCIAIALKKKLSTSTVYGLDISEQALRISKKNAVVNQVDIEFIQNDILNLSEDLLLPGLDIIVSNPPYIKKSEASQMNLNVLNFEPYLALFVPDNDALIFYKAIVAFSLTHLKNEGKLFFEINESLGKEIKSLLQANGFSNIEIKKDVYGKDRMVLASLIRSAQICK
jgi:release factor glutamine methyltransferase